MLPDNQAARGDFSTAIEEDYATDMPVKLNHRLQKFDSKQWLTRSLVRIILRKYCVLNTIVCRT